MPLIFEEHLGAEDYKKTSARGETFVRKHLYMTLNLIVPIGTVRFIFYELENNSFREERIGTLSYARITVPPRIWFGFQGISEEPSLILNVANMPHDPEEIERKSLEEIRFDWQEVK